MGKKCQKGMSVHEKALRLIEGGIVDCNGLSVRAIKIPYDDNPCMVCEMDSICNEVMINLCGECDDITHTKHYLKLVCG